MKKKRYLLAILLLTFSQFAFAEKDLHYCAHQTEYVKIGDTMAHVEKACGKPTQVISNLRAKTRSVDVEQWFYHFQDELITSPGEGSPVVLVFEKNILHSITSEGTSLSKATFCETGQAVSVGETMAQVKSKCGEPTEIHKGEQEKHDGHANITTWVLDQGAHFPKLIVEFEHGQVITIKTK